MKTTQFNFSKLISTLKYTGVAALFIGGLATFSGCAQKGCTDETADNYDADATEDDGTCIAARDKFLGQWLGTGCSETETFTITPSSTAGKVLVTSATAWFDCDGNSTFDQPISFTASVSGSSFTVDGGQSTCSNQVVHSGTGSIATSVLTLSYTATITGESPVTCTFTLTKQ